MYLKSSVETHYEVLHMCYWFEQQIETRVNVWVVYDGTREKKKKVCPEIHDVLFPRHWNKSQMLRLL